MDTDNTRSGLSFDQALSVLSQRLGIEEAVAPQPAAPCAQGSEEPCVASIRNRLQVVTHEGRRCLLLPSEHVIALAQCLQGAAGSGSLAETLASVPAPRGHLDIAGLAAAHSRHQAYPLPSLRGSGDTA